MKIFNFEEFNENYEYYIQNGTEINKVSKDEFIKASFTDDFKAKSSNNVKGFSLKIDNEKVIGTFE